MQYVIIIVKNDVITKCDACVSLNALLGVTVWFDMARSRTSSRATDSEAVRDDMYGMMMLLLYLTIIKKSSTLSLLSVLDLPIITNTHKFN